MVQNDINLTSFAQLTVLSSICLNVFESTKEQFHKKNYHKNN